MPSDAAYIGQINKKVCLFSRKILDLYKSACYNYDANTIYGGIHMITQSKSINRLWLRMLCLCMALCMLVGMLPATALAASTPSKLYLQPSNNWLKDGARFAAYFFGSGSKWVSGTKLSNGMYEFEVPAGYSNVIFCRMNGSSTKDDWNNKWNQTADLTVPTDGKNLYTVPGNTWDGSSNAYWSTYHVPVKHTVYFVNTANWSTVYAYVWGDQALVTWPGKEMTKTGDKIRGYDVYSYSFDGIYSQIIFNDTAGNQTGDMIAPNDQYYDVRAGKWYETIDPLSTDVSLTGEFNGWDTTAHEFRLDGQNIDLGYVSMTLEANKTYEFKIVKYDQWTSCATAITGSVDGLTFSRDVDGNCKITTKAAGTYAFSFNLNSSALSVVYPCDHVWVDATCQAPKTCSVCGKTEGVAAGHSDPNYINNGDTHTIDYPCCDALDTVGVAHDFTYDAENHTCICGAVETVVITYTVTWLFNETYLKQTYASGEIVEGFIPERMYYDSETHLGWDEFLFWGDLDTFERIETPFVMPERDMNIQAAYDYYGWHNRPGSATARYWNGNYYIVSDWFCVNDNVELVTDGNGTTYYADEEGCIVYDITEIQGVLYAFDHETGAFLSDYSGVYHASNGDEYYIKNGVAVDRCDVLGHNFVDGICDSCGAERYMTIYFQNNWFWSNVNLYYWGSESDENPAWGQSPMTYYDNDGTYDYYVMKVPVDVEGMLFSGIKDDGSNNLDQSPDIKSGWYDGIVYYMYWDNGNHTGTFNISDVSFPCKHVNQDIIPGRAADCINDGLTDGIQCSDCSEILQEQEPILALGHSYVPTAYEWADDYSACTVTGICDVCGDAFTEIASAVSAIVSKANCCEVAFMEFTADFVADWAETQVIQANDPSGMKDPNNHQVLAPNVPVDNGDGSHTMYYECCNTPSDQTEAHTDEDKNGRCDFCGALIAPAQLMKASVSLKGNIAINYYMLLSDAVLADSTAFMRFTLADGEICQIGVAEGVKMVLDEETYYVYTCDVSAKEMTDDILCQFFYEGGQSKLHTYSVQTYAKHIIASYDDEATKNLMAAMLNYGTASQVHFGYNTDNLASTGVTETPDYSNVMIDSFGTVSGQGTENSDFYAASLLLKSETTLRFFFTGAITATYQGKDLEVKQRGNLYYVDVVGISAKDLDEEVTIVINDGTNTADVTFNPMAYCQGVQNDTTGAFSAQMKDLVRALYLYNQAANVYFKEV